MAVPYVSRRRMNPRDMKAEDRFYPAPAYISVIDINQLAAEISEITALTPTEVVAVIRSLLQTVPKYMMLGYKVRLDTFGILKLGLRIAQGCGGHALASEVSASDIESLRVMFTPDVMLKEKLKHPEFVKLDAKYLDDGETGNKKSDDGITG